MKLPRSDSLSQWGSKMIKASKIFKDYNFRTYFSNHVKDDLQKLQKLPESQQRTFLQTEGRERLRAMRRMALVNRLFASQRHNTDPKSK